MVIHEHLIQLLRQQTTNVVQFIITRNSKITVQKKRTTLTARFTWPSVIEEDQATTIWYMHMKTPLGKNEIGKLMKTAAQAAGLQGNIINHSVRKTCISCLMDAEVPVNYVAQLSSHRIFR